MNRPPTERNSHLCPAVGGALDRPLKSLSGAIGVAETQLVAFGPFDPELDGVPLVGGRRLGHFADRGHVPSPAAKIKFEFAPERTRVRRVGRAAEAALGAGEFRAVGKAPATKPIGGLEIFQHPAVFRRTDPGGQEQPQHRAKRHIISHGSPAEPPRRGSVHQIGTRPRNRSGAETSATGRGGGGSPPQALSCRSFTRAVLEPTGESGG